jgi:ribosomal protein L11 methyltransferase
VTLAPKLAALLTRRGRVILSGLTHDQERMVSAAYINQGLRLQRRLRLDGWSTLVLGRG